PSPPPAARRPARLPAPRRAGDALAERAPRARRRPARARAPVLPPARLAGRARAARLRRACPARGRRAAPALLRDGAALARPDRRPFDLGALRRLRLRPAGAALAPALWPRPEQLLRLL